MRFEWLSHQKRNNLILFFSGWGVGWRPFSDLKSNCSDVIIIYDYTESALDLNLEKLCREHLSVTLIAWSMGVAMANVVCHPFSDLFKKAIAINGTISPVHEMFGISPEVMEKTIQNLSNGGLAKFYKRMCGNNSTHIKFNTLHDDFEGLDEELKVLYSRFNCILPEENIFKMAFIGKKDRIFSPSCQLSSWTHWQTNQRLLDEPHFPFFSWKNWEDITEYE